MLQRPFSTISIRNKNHKFNFINNISNFNSNSNSNYINQNNNTDSNTIYQSPKISSGKMRYMLENKKLFSLIDLNEKITNSKSPSLPIQFKRLTSEQINQLFEEKQFNEYKKRKKLKYISLKKNFLNKNKIKRKKDIKNDININTNNHDLNDENEKIIKSENNVLDCNENYKCVKSENNVNYDKNYTENNIQKFISQTEQSIEIKKNKKDEILKRPNTSRIPNLTKNLYNNFENNKNNNIKNDIWMPTNYKYFEQIVRDRKLFMEKMKQNPFFNRLPSCTLKDIQSKVHNTDIFFTNPPKQQSQFNSYMHYKSNIKNTNNTHYLSDIFNTKNDEINTQKIGEKFLFNHNENIKYTSSRESKSEWEGKVDKKSINNCSSKEYNILIPNLKNGNLMKEKVYKTLDNTNNNTNNPIHKHKTVSKYIDLANNSSSNPGRDYIYCYNSNNHCFKKIHEHCSSYGDLYLQYKNICDRPFYKKQLFI